MTKNAKPAGGYFKVKCHHYEYNHRTEGRDRVISFEKKFYIQVTKFRDDSIYPFLSSPRESIEDNEMRKLSFVGLVRNVEFNDTKRILVVKNELKERFILKDKHIKVTYHEPNLNHIQFDFCSQRNMYKTLASKRGNAFVFYDDYSTSINVDEEKEIREVLFPKITTFPKHFSLFLGFFFFFLQQKFFKLFSEGYQEMKISKIIDSFHISETSTVLVGREDENIESENEDSENVFDSEIEDSEDSGVDREDSEIEDSSSSSSYEDSDKSSEENGEEEEEVIDRF